MKFSDTIYTYPSVKNKQIRKIREKFELNFTTLGILPKPYKSRNFDKEMEPINVADLESGEKPENRCLEECCQKKNLPKPSEDEKKMARYLHYIKGLMYLLFCIAQNYIVLFWLYECRFNGFPFDPIEFIHNYLLGDLPVGLLSSYWTFLALTGIPIHIVTFWKVLKWRRDRLKTLTSIFHISLHFPLYVWLLLYKWNIRESPVLFWEGAFWISSWLFLIDCTFQMWRVLGCLGADMHFNPKPTYYCVALNQTTFNIWRDCHKLKYRKD